MTPIIKTYILISFDMGYIKFNICFLCITEAWTDKSENGSQADLNSGLFPELKI